MKSNFGNNCQKVQKDKSEKKVINFKRLKIEKVETRSEK